MLNLVLTNHDLNLFIGRILGGQGIVNRIGYIGDIQVTGVNGRMADGHMPTGRNISVDGKGMVHVFGIMRTVNGISISHV